jgi:hypothetical protein
MTKYLLILLFSAGMGMSSYAYTDTNREEEKKACDGGNLSGGYNLVAGFFVEFNRFEIILFDALSIGIHRPKVITP